MLSMLAMRDCSESGRVSMNDSFDAVCSRCAPSAFCPSCAKLVRMPSSRPNSRNAAMIEASVRKVRVLRRNSAAQTRWKYFMSTSSVSAASGRPDLLLDQHALVEMQGVARVLGRLRVVGDHHDGLAVLAVEFLQQAQDLLGGLPVEVAGGLVADQERRVGDDRARVLHTQLQADGRLGPLIRGAAGQAHRLQR